jgi:hypothetical protein
MKVAAASQRDLPSDFMASRQPAGSAESRYCRRLWTLQ